MSEERQPDIKVIIKSGSGEDENTETLWATSLGEDRYQLDNSPFWAYDISWGDVVLAAKTEWENVVEFRSMAQKSGNKTVRVYFDEPVQPGNASQAIADQLNEMKCYYEGISPQYLAFNIPHEVELDVVTAFLEGKPLQWEYADPSYETLFPE